MDRHLIIADDFTGAADTGVQLRRRGLAANVVFAGKKLPAGEGCTVIDTESRSIPPDVAASAVRLACAGLDFGSYKYVIKKVDSTLRGNIAVEVAALDSCYKSDLVVFAPALPALGRTTQNGVHCLNGVPLSKTELANDPKNPVAEDNINRILAGAYEEPVRHISLEEVRGGFSLSGARVFTFDAVTDEDMRIIIAAAKASSRRTLYVGTAAMADNIMSLESALPPVLGVIASVSDVTSVQVREAVSAGIRAIVIPFHKILSKDKTRAEYAREAVQSLKDGNDTMLVSSSTLDRAELDADSVERERLGMTMADASNFVRSEMGALAAEVLAESAASGIFVTGGDTALGLLDALVADGSEILSEVSVGIPMMRLIGGKASGIKMVTKAGAFGASDAIKSAFRKLKEV